MSYKVIVIMTKNLLQAIDIGTDEKSEIISIDGNSTIGYNAENDIVRFCNCIKDYYNVESFCELNMSSMLIKCGVDNTYANFINDLFTDCTDNNIIDIKVALPIVVVSKGIIKKSESFTVTILDSSYIVTANQNSFITCVETVSKCDDEVYVLDTEQFGILYYYKTDCFSIDESVLIEKEYEIKQIQKKHKQSLQMLKSELIDSVNKRKKLEKEILEITEKNRQLEEYEKKFMSLDRYVIEIPDYFIDRIREIEENRKKSRCFHTYLNQENKNYNYIIKAKLKDGEPVNSNTIIIQGIRTDIGSSINESYVVFKIFAGHKGKVFYLIDQEESICQSKHIAIIGHELDTKESIMKWYKQKLKDNKIEAECKNGEWRFV